MLFSNMSKKLIEFFEIYGCTRVRNGFWNDVINSGQFPTSTIFASIDDNKKTHTMLSVDFFEDYTVHIYIPYYDDHKGYFTDNGDDLFIEVRDVRAGEYETSGKIYYYRIGDFISLKQHDIEEFDAPYIFYKKLFMQNGSKLNVC